MKTYHIEVKEFDPGQNNEWLGPSYPGKGFYFNQRTKGIYLVYEHSQMHGEYGVMNFVLPQEQSIQDFVSSRSTPKGEGIDVHLLLDQLHGLFKQ